MIFNDTVASKVLKGKHCLYSGSDEMMTDWSATILFSLNFREPFVRKYVDFLFYLLFELVYFWFWTKGLVKSGKK